MGQGAGLDLFSTQRNALLADYLSFHLWQAGDPQFPK